MLRRLGSVASAIGAAAWCLPTFAGSSLPDGFVRLSDVAPSIRQDMRYAGSSNFTGGRVPGYKAPVCILARPVAEALKRVQARLAPRNLSLMVFDCYRPQRAVDAFLAWAERGVASDRSSYYHPNIARSQIVSLGYVARTSSHSRGTAVDLTIIRTARGEKEVGTPGARQEPTNARSRIQPGSCLDVQAATHGDKFDALDMGTAFDCFDEKSRMRHPGISATAQANRQLLLQAMTTEGFKNYAGEWWHFSMPLKQFTKPHNFDVD